MIDDTNLDLSQLLPSKRELLSLINRLSPNDEQKDADTLWEEVEKKCKEECDEDQHRLAHPMSRQSMQRTTINFSENGGKGDTEDADMAQKTGGRKIAEELQADPTTDRKARKMEDKRQELYRKVKSADVLLRLYQVRQTDGQLRSCCTSVVSSRLFPVQAPNVVTAADKHRR